MKKETLFHCSCECGNTVITFGVKDAEDDFHPMKCRRCGEDLRLQKTEVKTYENNILISAEVK